MENDKVLLQLDKINSDLSEILKELDNSRIKDLKFDEKRVAQARRVEYKVEKIMDILLYNEK